MNFKVLFVGGKRDGQIAEVAAKKFDVGMQIHCGGEFYTIQDGAAARCFDKLQAGHENLVARAVFEGLQPAI